MGDRHSPFSFLVGSWHEVRIHVGEGLLPERFERHLRLERMVLEEKGVEERRVVRWIFLRHWSAFEDGRYV
jgi:hypothetical protein